MFNRPQLSWGVIAEHRIDRQFGGAPTTESARLQLTGSVGEPHVSMLLPSLFRNGRRLGEYLEGELREIDHPVARALARRRVLRGTGPDGAWLPRDHRRAVLAGMIVLVGGWSLAMWCFNLADARAGTRANSVLTGVGVFFLFGSSYASWQGVKHLRGAMRRTPRAPAS